MADNFTTNSGSGGNTYASDDISSVHYPRVKISWGVDGSAVDASNTNPFPVSDGSGSLTVDNAALSVTGGGVEASALRVTLASDSTGVLSVDDNGSTLSVDDGGSTVSVDDGGSSLTVDNAALSVTGGGVEASALRVTLASDSTGVLSVDDNGSSLTVDGTVAVSSITTAVVPGTGATNLGKAEDAAHSSGDVGVMALAVRQSSQADFGADGDYVPFSVDDDGGLRVSIVAGAGSGGTAAADDADFTDGTTQGTPAMGVYESTPTTVTDGDLGVVGITEDRQLKVSVGNTVTVASHAVTNAGTFAVQATMAAGATTIAKAEDAQHSSGDVGVPALTVRQDTAAALGGTDADYQPLITDSSGRLHVNVGNTVTVGSHAVTNAGTFATQVDGAALTALQLIDNPVLVDDAAFTPATSSVMMAGFQADETAADSVNEGDAGAARMSLDRKVYVIAHDETSTIYQNGTARTPAFASIDVASSGDNTLLAAQGSGNIIRVHQLVLVASAAVTVRFESGAGGTALTGQMQLAANSGFVLPYSPIGWFQTAANTLLNLELSGATSVDGCFAYTVVT